jgi:hypothetical protein
MHECACGHQHVRAYSGLIEALIKNGVHIVVAAHRRAAMPPSRCGSLAIASVCYAPAHGRTPRMHIMQALAADRACLASRATLRWPTRRMVCELASRRYPDDDKLKSCNFPRLTPLLSRTGNLHGASDNTFSMLCLIILATCIKYVLS